MRWNRQSNASLCLPKRNMNPVPLRVVPSRSFKQAKKLS